MAKHEHGESLEVPLEATLRALEQRVAALETALQPGRTPGRMSMKADRCCPACGANRILHAREVLDRSDAGRSRLALAQPSLWRDSGVGEFEIYVCTGCGLCEWHVRDLKGVEVDGDKIRLVESSPPASPGPK